jgi:hypothetical protein
MAYSEMQKKTIDLGKQLLLGFEDGGHPDLLCQWIAHYLAEQISKIEKTRGRERTATRNKCFETILRLWSHRASLPNGYRPFEEFEPLLNALQALNPNNPHPYYHHFKPADRARAGKQKDAVSQLVDFIFATDAAARVVIDIALDEIVKHAATKRNKSILKSIPNISRRDSANAVRILIERVDVQKNDRDLRDDMFKKRLEALRSFSAICRIFEKGLKNQLKKDPS